MKRSAVLALLLAACVLQPSAPAPATSAVPGAPQSPTITSAGNDKVVSFPDCDSRSLAGSAPACDVAQVAVDHDVFVAVLSRASVSGLTFEARAVELATGATRVLRPLADTEIVIEDVRDALVLLRETESFGGGDFHVRLLSVPWRDPARATILEEEDLSAMVGADRWVPWPYAKTNGRDVVWLRATGPLTAHEIVLLAGNGPARVIARTDRRADFDLDDSGRVALSTTSADRAELQIYDGLRTRVLSSRPEETGGLVMSFPDVIGWARGYGTAQPLSEIDLVPIGGGPTRPGRAESSCLIVGSTLRDLVTACPAGVRLIDVATGVARDGPASRIVLAFRRGLVWQMSADLRANPLVWRIRLL
jgi:hypothetical protein